MTVNTRAMDLRTVALYFYSEQMIDDHSIPTHIFVSLDAEPPAILCTRS